MSDSEIRAEIKAVSQKVKCGDYTKPQGQAIKSLLRRLLEISKLRREYAKSKVGSPILSKFFGI